MSDHRHEFTALWWHFGPYGSLQDVHVHGCFTEGCDRVVIGEGRECNGVKRQKHERYWLTEDGPVKVRPRSEAATEKTP